MDYVAGFMFSKDRSVVALIIKNKPDWQNGRFNGIGGKIERGESSVSAMVREFEEETGVCTQQGDWVNFSTIDDADNHWRVDFFSCFSDKVYDVKSIEAEKVVLCSPRSLSDKCLFNLHWLIPLALDDDIGHVTAIDDAPICKD